MRIANRVKEKSKAEFRRKVLERFSSPGNLFDLTIPKNWSVKDVKEILESENVMVFVVSPNTIHTFTRFPEDIGKSFELRR